MPYICKHPDCDKQPSFGFPGGIKQTCGKHREEGMVPFTVQRRCRKCGLHQPSYNEPGKKPAIYCGKCKTDTMIDVNKKRCKCGKSAPVFNKPGEKPPVCCAECKTDDMIDIRSRRCLCKRALPNYNEPGEKIPICCQHCKTPTMVNVKNKLCACGKRRGVYNKPGETRGEYCSECRTDEMIPVANIKKTCRGLVQENLPCPFNTRGNPRYRMYCVECFKRNFPLDPLTFEIRSKTKEIAVRDFINANFDGFQHDKPIWTGNCDCSVRRRIDHRKLIGNTLLSVETDENMHSSYDPKDEEIRYDDLYMAFAGRWIYIRFNPDKYWDTSGRERNPPMGKRLDTLKKEMEKQLERISRDDNTEPCEIIHLFYNGFED